MTHEPKTATLTNASFSQIIPNLQIAWDSTSSGELKTCPRKYQYSILEGWQPRHTSVHLTFGLHYHAALERYDHARSAGLSHLDALFASVRYCLEITWDQDKGRPWASEDPNKNRYTLLRTVVWYIDQFEHDTLHTVQLANGKPAVELSFRFETDYTTSQGETYIACGHFDRVVEFNSDTYILDRKTSKHTIDEKFFNQFTPHNQFTIYTVAGKVAYKIPVKGLIVDAAQVAVTFSRFARGFINRHDDQLDEWYKGLGVLLVQAESYAQADYWPMNEQSCGNYGGCPFRGICSKAPAVREEWLRSMFVRRVWDPLQTRGDI